MTALFSVVIACDVFYLMLYSTLINTSELLSAEKQAFVNISISLFSSFYLLLQNLQNPEEFHKEGTTL